jgi:preprotein translocase subunit SecD
MKRWFWIKLGLIVLIVVIEVFLLVPGLLGKVGIHKEIKVRKGLDLIGGSHIVYEADMSKISAQDRPQALNSLIDVINRRVNALGVAEPVIQSRKYGDTYGIIIELPGINNVDDAIKVIGKTAQLKFKDSPAGANQIGGSSDWQDTSLSGAHLTKAEAQIDQQGNPEISISFNSDGAKIFADLTQKNLQKPIAIFLDDQLISAPTVQSAITDGKAVITGQFTIQEAKDLALQLNAGALPVPISIAEQRNVGATLGADSIQKSLFAGVIAFISIILFMLLYYRIPGLMAVLALSIYGMAVLSIFKISSLTPWGITLTLAGITGFVLSVGMAVDANILIFERTKEELRAGYNLLSAIDRGFARAWPSIRDSNVSSLITCGILFWFGTGSIRGFAVTLAIGILVSMFTAITVTRTFLQLMTLGGLKNRINFFNIKKNATHEVANNAAIGER